MRFYELRITDPATGKPPLDAAGNPIGPFDTRLTPGRGLHIEFDVNVAALDVVSCGTMLAVYGLPVGVIGQAVRLEGCRVSLLAGFSKGLPLANPDQHGQIISGVVFKAYANWTGTNQSLNLVINPVAWEDRNGTALNISASGQKGEKLGDVLVRALKPAFPGKKIDCRVNDNLILPEACPLVYPMSEVATLATVVRSLSIAIMRQKDYQGVGIIVQSDSVRIFDNSAGVWDSREEIRGWELIGQPTWIEPFRMTFKCPLRGDLRCGDTVTLPRDMISGPASVLMTSTSPGAVLPNNNLTFTGRFHIVSVRHIGAFLVPDGDAWVTVFEAVPQVQNQTQVKEYV